MPGVLLFGLLVGAQHLVAALECAPLCTTHHICGGGGVAAVSRSLPVADALSNEHLALGDVLREQRRAMGLSQDATADRGGLHRVYYGRIERGELNVAWATCSRSCSRSS